MVRRRRPRPPPLPRPSHGTQRPIEAPVRSRPSDPRQPLDSQRHQVRNSSTQITRGVQLLTTASSQHYNKKLRTLAPATEGTSAVPSTPIRSATKRKAPGSKTADPSDSPTPAAERGRGKKKAAAAKAVSEEAAERDDDDDDDEKSPAKKAKVNASEDASEGQE